MDEALWEKLKDVKDEKELDAGIAKLKEPDKDKTLTAEEYEKLLKDNPSLKSYLDKFLQSETDKVVLKAVETAISKHDKKKDEEAAKTKEEEVAAAKLAEEEKGMSKVEKQIADWRNLVIGQ